MASPLETAERRLAEIEKEATQLRWFIDQYRHFAGLRSLRPTKAHNPGMPAAVARVAEQVLRDAGRPMRRGALAYAIEATGFSLPGIENRKSSYVGTVLFRHPETFFNIPGCGYWLQDEREGGPICNTDDDVSQDRVAAHLTTGTLRL